MHRIGTTAAAVAELLNSINVHMPVGVDMGEPVAVVRGTLMFELDGRTGVLSIDERGLHRWMVHRDGTVELSGWHRGRQRRAGNPELLMPQRCRPGTRAGHIRSGARAVLTLGRPSIDRRRAFIDGPCGAGLRPLTAAVES